MSGDTVFIPMVAAIVAALTPGGTTITPAADPPAENIVVQSDPMSRMTVPVRVNGRPFVFLLDTGAQATVVSTQAVTQVGLHPTGSMTIAGTVGSASVPTVVVSNLTLGKTTHDSVVTPLLDRSAIGADGIIGIDGMLGQRLTLDFQKNRVEIANSRSAGLAFGYDFRTTGRRGYRNLMITNGTIDGHPVDVVIDTGANISIGNGQLRRLLSERTEWKPVVVEAVTGQKTLGEIGVVSRMTLGKARFYRLPIAFIDVAPFDKLGLSKRPALLLGMRELRMFKRIAIDFSKNRVHFDLPDQRSPFLF